MSNNFCALGCTPTKNLYIFPNRTFDFKRRKLWLDYFDMEEPNTASVFACEKHFSSSQTTFTGIRNDAVPDIPVICNPTVYPFKRKPKNWRTNVIVVTPRDPEFTIYRHETGIFPQNLFNNIDTSQPIIKMPIISSVACSMSSQTNTRFCGLVQISDIKEEYRLNCFYCCATFPIEKWSMFVNHLKSTHFELEEAFKTPKYLSQDHDYTSIWSSNVESTATYPKKANKLLNSFVNLPLPSPVHQQTNKLPPLLAKPPKHIGMPTTECVVKKPEITLPPLLPKPQQPDNKIFNISMADEVIKLLNETLLSPKFLQTEDDNILIIKNTGSGCIETSNFLKNLVNYEGGEFSLPQKLDHNIRPRKSNISSSFSKTRQVYTISSGLQDIPSVRNSLSHMLMPPLPKNKKANLVQRRIAQQALKNIHVFEDVYKTVKKRSPNVVEFADYNDSSTKEDIGQKISNLTPLSRCLKRTISEAPEVIKKVPINSTEIVFEYTPRDIVVSLIEQMKNFPVLWEFHEQPFNKNYNNAIEQLCRCINKKWSLNITLLKMKRSINRILRFYRFMSPREDIDKFEEYFDKCALFLPSSADEIPRVRCVYCCVCFKKDSDLRKHVIARHNALKWPYKCQQCFEPFRGSDEYELHKRLPHYEEVFKCEHCSKRFLRRHLYNKHIASHEKTKQRRIEASNPNNQYKRFICSVCRRAFNTISNLNIHKTCHKVKCHLCPKEFCSRSGLTIHLKKHNNELDYMCEVCGKGFILKSYLDEHMKKHTGDKITCNICNLKLRKCNLLRHLRLVHIVTEGTIQSTFRAKSYRYRKHFRTQKRSLTEGPRNYNCKICKISFDRLKHLKDHNKLVHFDVKRTSCRLCTVEFIHIPNLKRHYKCKHNLHMYQIFLLVDQKEDLDKVLAMKAEELDGLIPHEISFGQSNVRNENFFEGERMRSDEIQEEIMKAVENLDKQDIKVDDDHSMHNFFTDLL